MTEAQRAANAIWEAFNKVSERVGVFEDHGDALAAAFRVAAVHCKRDRLILLALADELES